MHLDKCEMFLHTKRMFPTPVCKLLTEITARLMTLQPVYPQTFSFCFFFQLVTETQFIRNYVFKQKYPFNNSGIQKWPYQKLICLFIIVLKSKFIGQFKVQHSDCLKTLEKALQNYTFDSHFQSQEKKACITKHATGTNGLYEQ